MKTWHCSIGGRPYGPVSQDELKKWIAEGRVGPADLVWHEGMAEWAVAHTVPEFFPEGAPLAMASLVPVVPPGGTGGQTPNVQLMAEARESLRDRWGLAIGFTVLFMLLNIGASQVPFGGLILGGPLQLGFVIFFLTFVRRGNAEIGMLFTGFKNFGNALAAYLLMFIFTFLWALLLIVPGIIAALSYSQTFYLLADDTTLGPLDAIRKSKEMMIGRKWKLFCLGLRFLGWVLLCLLTCGIGLIFLTPYMGAAMARFYDDLRAAPGEESPRDTALQVTEGTDFEG